MILLLYYFWYFSSMLVILVAAISPTRFNISSFDLANCQSNPSFLLYGVYVFELLVGLFVGVVAIRQKTVTRPEKIQNIFIGISDN